MSEHREATEAAAGGEAMAQLIRAHQQAFDAGIRRIVREVVIEIIGEGRSQTLSPSINPGDRVQWSERPPLHHGAPPNIFSGQLLYIDRGRDLALVERDLHFGPERHHLLHPNSLHAEVHHG